VIVVLDRGLAGIEDLGLEIDEKWEMGHDT